MMSVTKELILSKRPVVAKRPRTDSMPAGEQGAMMESAPEKVLPPLELPSNATSIRAEISDTFSCKDRGYGYYADVDNECQIFHVCLPVVYGEERKERTFRWSFICPEETAFSQQVFTCVRMEDMLNECKDSEQFYELNSNFGMTLNESSDTMKETDSEMMPETNQMKMNNKRKKNPMMQQMMIEKIEMTTDSKMIMEEKRKPVEEKKEMPKKPVMEPMMTNELNSNVRPADPMTDGLLPPLANEVYRAGANGETQMLQPQVLDLAVQESALSEDQFVEVIELEGETSRPQASTNLKDSVIQAVENIIETHAEVTSNPEAQAQLELKKMRRIPGRRFLFKADVKRNY